MFVVAPLQASNIEAKKMFVFVCFFLLEKQACFFHIHFSFVRFARFVRLRAERHAKELGAASDCEKMQVA